MQMFTIWFALISWSLAIERSGNSRKYDDGKYRPSNANAYYKFAYSVNNPVTGDVKRHSETRDENEVKGSYFLIEPDGGQRLVEYTAGLNGFNAHVKRSSPSYRSVYVETPLKNYYTDWNERNNYVNRAYERQTLHTQVFRPTFHSRNNDIKDFYKAQNPLLTYNWTNDDQYSQSSFYNRNQNKYQTKRIDLDQKIKFFGVRPRKISKNEPYFNFDIRRAAPDKLFYQKN